MCANPVSSCECLTFCKIIFERREIQPWNAFIDDSTPRTLSIDKYEVPFYEYTSYPLLDKGINKSMSMESVIFWCQEVEPRFVEVFFWTEAFWWNPGRWTCQIEGFPFIPFLITLNNNGRTLTDNCGQFFLLDWSLQLTGWCFPLSLPRFSLNKNKLKQIPKNCFWGFW